MFRYFGPPGTGKTTTLLDKVDELLAAGMSPTNIGYFSFTRKAAHEARDRAVARFNLDAEEDFVYFRTLHSLAFLLLGLSSASVLTDKHLKVFSFKVGVDLSAAGLERVEEEGFAMMRSNHPVMRCVDLARNTLQGTRHAYGLVDLDIPFYEFEHLFNEYDRFKKLNGLKDFTDMMVDLSANPGYIPYLKTVFLDEAQDLTPLQWQVAEHLGERSDQMFVAGDDDQGIYRWSGADIDKFVMLPGASEVLSQSYRVPRSVHHVATSVVSRIRKRQKKEWSPRTEEGSVTRIYDPQGIEFNDKEWLILAQANYMLDELAASMRSNGHFFERFNNPSLSKRVRTAIGSWTHLQNSPGNEISLKDAQNLYAHISTEKTGIERGAKKLLDRAEEQDLFTLETLRKHFGLRVLDVPWDSALDRIRDEDRAYAAALLNRGVNIFQKPKIRLSTIHGAKGGEADNVLLYLDLSGKALMEMERNPDDAYRVLYVGITRAKENLILKMSEDSQRGWSV